MITALIVDDDQEILDLLEERLLSMGHECRTAQSQTQAEEILNEHIFDYILLDLEIPNRFQGRADIVYGHNLLRKIRQTPGHSRVPVLAITAHGLKSHHLCAETMKLGATDFVGKPFGRDNPLEERIREALRPLNDDRPRESAPNAGKLQPFKGGDLVFYDDRIELCGVKICGAKGSSIKRKTLELLRERNTNGKYRCLQMKDIATLCGLDRPGAVAEAVADLRRDYRERLREQRSIECAGGDVLANQNCGYHLRDWINVYDGLDAVQKATVDKQIVLSACQSGIIRLLRKHGRRTPRQLSDSLNVLRNVITTEVELLTAAGLVASDGNGASRVFKLTESSVPASQA